MLWAVSTEVELVGHNSGLILGIKDHICSDTVRPYPRSQAPLNFPSLAVWKSGHTQGEPGNKTSVSGSFLHAHHSMYCESTVKHAWLWYLPAVIEHDQSPQPGAELPSQPSEAYFAALCAVSSETLTHTYSTNASWTHFSLHHTLSPNYILNKPRKRQETRQREKHTRL